MQGIIEGSRMLGSAGESFVNSFQKGLQMSMAVEKNKRQKQIDNLTLLKNAQDEIDLVTQKYGSEAGQSYAETLNKRLSPILGDNNKLTPQGVKTFLYDEDRIDYMLNDMGLEDTEANRDSVKKFFKNMGMGETDPLGVNLFSSTNTGKVDWDETLKLGEIGRTIRTQEKTQEIEALEREKEAGKEFQNKFLEDRLILKYQTTAGEIEKAIETLDLASEGNPITSKTISQIMPRLAGEVGNLTTEEQRAYGGSKAIYAQLNQITKTWLDGTLTPENIKYLKEITNAFAKANERNYRDRAEKLLNSEVAGGFITKEYATKIISSFISISEDSTVSESKDPMGLGL